MIELSDLLLFIAYGIACFFIIYFIFNLTKKHTSTTIILLNEDKIPVTQEPIWPWYGGYNWYPTWFPWSGYNYNTVRRNHILYKK